jgi:hypothetical protein
MLSLDQLDHPDFVTPTGFANVAFPACLGPLRYADRGPLEQHLSWTSPSHPHAKLAARPLKLMSPLERHGGVLLTVRQG